MDQESAVWKAKRSRYIFCGVEVHLLELATLAAKTTSNRRQVKNTVTSFEACRGVSMDELCQRTWIRIGLLTAILICGNQIPGEGLAQADSSRTGQSSPQAQPSEKLEKALLIVTPEYFIGPEDVLTITVWRNADLSREVTVRPDGRISLPLIGDITAVGRTPAQLSEDISAKLKEYKENPQVSIVIKEVNSYAIYVLGEVAKPGKYPLRSKTTLLQGITIASGFTQTAARNKMVVFRFAKDGQGQVKIKASYDDIVLRDGSNQNIELKPGDQIVVPSETMVLVP
jgi:polysaccharide biosynthesis/export protein